MADPEGQLGHDGLEGGVRLERPQQFVVAPLIIDEVHGGIGGGGPAGWPTGENGGKGRCESNQGSIPGIFFWNLGKAAMKIRRRGFVPTIPKQFLTVQMHFLESQKKLCWENQFFLKNTSKLSYCRTVLNKRSILNLFGIPAGGRRCWLANVQILTGLTSIILLYVCSFN